MILIPKKSDRIQVKSNGYDLEFDQPPVIVNGRTMVPIRKIFESLGAKLDWNESTNKISATRGKTQVTLVIGDNEAYVDGNLVKLDQPAEIINGRALVPLRFIGESLGLDVYWDNSNRRIYIAQNKKEEPKTPFIWEIE